MLAMLPTHSVIAKVDAMTEGSLYLAWIGPSVALGEWFARREINRDWTVVKPVSLALGVFLIVILCQWRVSVWRDPVALWQEATLRAPDSARAWSNLGVAQLARGHNEAARLALQAALHLDPNNAQARFNLDIIAAFTPSSRSTLEP
jgi:protein O-mannosyl-transferase